MPQLNFNVADAPEMRPQFGPLPEGEYEMVVTRTDIKPTKAGTGQYLEAEMQVVSGELSGRRHWERFNIDNPNKQAEDIAKAQLGALCTAVGVTEMTDTEQLHDTPFVASFEIDRKEPTRNRIVGYSQDSAAPAPKAATKQEPKAASSRPWAK